MMRARMRSPRWTVSRCSAEYDGDPRSAEFWRSVGGVSVRWRFSSAPPVAGPVVGQVSAVQCERWKRPA